MAQLNIRQLNKLLKLTGDRARLDAKAKDSHIVYHSKSGMIKEYPDGTKVYINTDEQTN